MPNPFAGMGNPAQLLKMQMQAKKMQRRLAAEDYEVEEGGIKVVVRGDREVKEIEIDGERQPRLVETVNKALKKAEREAAMKVLSEGGLSALLGRK